MSYDITLYRKDFLKRAIEENLGDWTNADPIPEEVLRTIIAAAAAAGFVHSPIDPGFAEFLKQEGVEPGTEFVLDTPTLCAELSIYPGEVAFSIPYGSRSHASVEFCGQLAKQMATNHGLGFRDPQTGDEIYE